MNDRNKCVVSKYSLDHSEWVHKDFLPDLSHARDHMLGVLEILYANGCIEDLEWHLEEVLCILKMDMPPGKLKINKRKK